MELTDGTVAGTGTPSLPARSRPWSARLLEDPRTLGRMVQQAGGPFHVLHPATFGENVRAFQSALLGAGVDGQVMYGKKANKSSCWLAACVDTGAGVDVASAQELVHSLAHGVRGEDLVVTGAAKSTELLWLAIRHRALVAVDALDELARLTALARSTGRARVLLRVVPPAEPDTRFGLAAGELDTALQRIADTGGAVEMCGFSFHLSGYDAAPRAELAAELVRRCAAERARGHRADTISIGGGFAVSYVEARAWDEFLARHDEGLYHAGRRPDRFYPYHQEPAGADMLAAILAHRSGEGPPLADVLARTGVRLLLEPGRALLDGAGLTVFGVQGFKPRGGTEPDGRARGIVTVDGLSMSVSEQWKGSEFLPDPELWPRAGIVEPVAACVGGASCMEYDMLTWRRVPFPRSPQPGDLLVYPNTAGYQMDKNESEFHQLPLPVRFVVGRGSDENAAPVWRPER